MKRYLLAVFVMASMPLVAQDFGVDDDFGIDVSLGAEKDVAQMKKKALKESQ